MADTPLETKLSIFTFLIQFRVVIFSSIFYAAHPPSWDDEEEN